MESIDEKRTILDVRTIDLNLSASTKDEVIHELSSLLYQEKYLTDLTGFIEDVYEREKEGITGIGNNVAIPHGKSDSVTQVGIAIGRTQELIEWESYDEKPVSLFFLFAVPGDVEGAKLHLKLLSKIASKLSDDELLESLKVCNTANEVIQLLNM